MIEVVRRCASGAVLLAVVATVADARATVGTDTTGVVIRAGAIAFVIEPPGQKPAEDATDTHEEVGDIFAGIQHASRDEEEDALLGWGAWRADRWNETRHERRVCARIARRARRTRVCPICDRTFPVEIHTKPGPTRFHCSDRCAATARQRRKRAIARLGACHGDAGFPTIIEADKVSCPQEELS